MSVGVNWSGPRFVLSTDFAVNGARMISGSRSCFVAPIERGDRRAGVVDEGTGESGGVALGKRQRAAALQDAPVKWQIRAFLL